MEAPIAWLLQGPPWASYRTRRDLLGLPEDDAAVCADRAAMLAHPLVQGLLAELAAWPGDVLKSHKSAGHLLHKLTLAADLGLSAEDSAMAPVVERIRAHQAAEGPFQVLANVPVHFGGSGQDAWSWSLCDAPLVLYALAGLGPGAEPDIARGVSHLADLVRPNGWPCAVAPEMGRFRGPGPKDDPCPFANLAMLKLLARLPAWRDCEPAHLGAEAALELWTARRERHPYLFYMGTDFCKLKAPLVWYDLLHVLDVLSQFPWLRSDPRLADMGAILAAKADDEGRFTPESIWTAYKGWDFGQKKVPSPWLTLLAWRTMRRLTAS